MEKTDIISTPTIDSAVNFVSNDELEASSSWLEASSQLPPTKKVLNVEEKYQLLRTIGECIQEDELRSLLAKKPIPIAYDGFEPSGRMLIEQVILKVLNVNKLVAANCSVKILIADTLAEGNNEIGGDMIKIQTVGRYFIEICKAAGMRLANVQFLWSSERIVNDPMYWRLVTAIAKANTVSSIRTREEGTDKSVAAQIVYPCMKCVDVFFLEADICLLGMDHREVSILATEYCNTIKRKNKPVILSHYMLSGLQLGKEMLKSKTSSSIYMEDGVAEVRSKIKKTYCPPKTVEGNTCLEYLKHLVFPWFGKIEVVRTPESGGGNKEYNSFEVLAEDYASDVLHPGDLKTALAKAINEILQPVRNHFETDSTAKELLKAVKSYKVTR